MEGRAALDKLRRFGAIFRRRVLAGSPPVLERRLIAFPKAWDMHCSGSNKHTDSSWPGGRVQIAHVRFVPKADMALILKTANSAMPIQDMARRPLSRLELSDLRRAPTVRSR